MTARFPLEFVDFSRCEVRIPRVQWSFPHQKGLQVKGLLLSSLWLCWFLNEIHPSAHILNSGGGGGVGQNWLFWCPIPCPLFEGGSTVVIIVLLKAQELCGKVESKVAVEEFRSQDDFSLPSLIQYYLNVRMMYCEECFSQSVRKVARMMCWWCAFLCKVLV